MRINLYGQTWGVYILKAMTSSIPSPLSSSSLGAKEAVTGLRGNKFSKRSCGFTELDTPDAKSNVIFGIRTICYRRIILMSPFCRYWSLIISFLSITERKERELHSGVSQVPQRRQPQSTELFPGIFPLWNLLPVLLYQGTAVASQSCSLASPASPAMALVVGICVVQGSSASLEMCGTTKSLFRAQVSRGHHVSLLFIPCWGSLLRSR